MEIRVGAKRQGLFDGDVIDSIMAHRIDPAKLYTDSQRILNDGSTSSLALVFWAARRQLYLSRIPDDNAKQIIESANMALSPKSSGDANHLMSTLSSVSSRPLIAGALYSEFFPYDLRPSEMLDPDSLDPNLVVKIFLGAATHALIGSQISHSNIGRLFENLTDTLSNR